jgi:hypothetical protein
MCLSGNVANNYSHANANILNQTNTTTSTLGNGGSLQSGIAIIPKSLNFTFKKKEAVRIDKENL